MKAGYTKLKGSSIEWHTKHAVRVSIGSGSVWLAWCEVHVDRHGTVWAKLAALVSKREELSKVESGVLERSLEQERAHARNRSSK